MPPLPSKLQNECGLHRTFTFLISFEEVTPPRRGLKSFFTSTVGAVVAAGIFRAWTTENCREHKILSLICSSSLPTVGNNSEVHASYYVQ